MSIFQKSVLTSIKQNESLVASRWANYQNYLAKIDFIKSVKEEKFQDGFLKDIFESCLGYTLDSTNPANFNLEREKKNETDGKKADGVIVINGEIVGIVELKDQKTKNLDSVEAQAFNYHNSHSNSKYIIISNFDELRFYIDKKTAYEKFSLFSLSYEEFKTLHLLLSYENIKDNIPLKLKEKSLGEEQRISKELYRDFSAFRTHLFDNIIKKNDMDKSLLLRLTQKLCDRIIFILFAEDRGLLKPNTIKEIRTRHAEDGFGDRSMYDYYKLYFNAINEGNERLSIPKYNGGLFATDELLDSLIIDDEYLDMEAQKLSDFDFVSEISVNILGHIFEQSLTDLEEINASINDIEFDKKKSKRKKDGVFYTPEYITRYIVENTLGKLCNDKKAELKIEAETVVVNPRKLTKIEQSYKETLLNYREWLTHLKILDPACGSGAFLNQALEFLIREHTLIRDLLLPYEDLMIGYEVEKSILEHNLYGVDINEDAVEIARLSLWLRTAHKGRELINLGAKIKCGNSLIADRSVAENAFVWEDEFPEVFEQGGFDVVIGNPPYVNLKLFDKQIVNYLSSAYANIHTGYNDILYYFFVKGLDVLSPNGKLLFITSNYFLGNTYAQKLRTFLVPYISQIINFKNFMVFESANVHTVIIGLEKMPSSGVSVCNSEDGNLDHIPFNLERAKLSDTWLVADVSTAPIFDKLENDAVLLGSISTILKGATSGNREIFTIKKDFAIENKFEIDLLRQSISSKDIQKYELIDSGEFLIYTDNSTDIKMYPNIENYLKNYYDILNSRNEVKKGVYAWYRLERPRNKAIFEAIEKIIVPYRADCNKFAFDNKQSFNDGGGSYAIVITDIEISIKYVLALLNSKLFDWYYGFVGKPKGNAREYFNEPLSKIPLKKIPFENQAHFIILVDEIIETKPKIKEYKSLLEDAIKNDNFDREIKLKKEIETMENRVIECEKEIDVMVYALYGLSEDEIAIVGRQ